MIGLLILLLAAYGAWAIGVKIGTALVRTWRACSRATASARAWVAAQWSPNPPTTSYPAPTSASSAGAWRSSRRP